MKSLFRAIIIIIYFYPMGMIHAQETAILVKFKSETIRQSVVSDSKNSLHLRSVSKTVNLIPSYPNAKNPELKLYYDIKMIDNSTEIINALHKENIFTEISTYDIAYTTNAGCVVTNDSVFADGSDYYVQLVRADCAWLITKGSSFIFVGIADTEFQETHEDLCNQVLSVSGQITANASEHGTLVAGNACAEPNNGKGIKGIGYNTKFKGYRIPHNPSAGTASSFDIKDAIWNAYLDGCRVINVSWTGTGLQPSGAQEITDSGTVLVVSAGNNANTVCHSTIADIPGVLCVSSVDRDNNYYPGHARNQYVDLCAPGREMVTTSAFLQYRIVWGTSHAAPCVAGAAALVLSVNPLLSAAEVEDILKITTRPINNASSYPGQIGTGCLDVYSAVQAAQTACTTPAITLNNQTITINNTITSCNTITAQNVTVTNNAKLRLVAPNAVTINGSFEVQLGSQLEVN